MRIMRILMPILIILLLPGLASASAWYVRTDGSDSTCNGLSDSSAASAPNCAFRTVQKGVDNATSPGDIVNIRGDHTSEGLIVSKANGCIGSGCYGNPTYITIQTTPGAPQYSGTIGPGIRLGHSYIIIQGLGITGSYGFGSGFNGVTLGWDGPANHCQIKNNHFYNPASPVGSSAIVFGSDSHFNIAEGNLIEGDTNPVRVTGHHTGPSGTTLTDSYYSWTLNQWVGRPVWDFSSGGWDGTSAGTVVSNDEHSVVTTAGITWNTNDCYLIGTSFWLPIIISGTDNTIRNNIIRNLANTERVFDGMSDNTVISGNEVADLLDGNDLAGGTRPAIDNCGAHTDIFQVWDNQAVNILIENNYFHDLQSQTGMLEGNGKPVENWTMRNNVFANIVHRNTFMNPGFKWINNVLFNVAQSDQVYPLEGWSPGGEYKNNIIIGGTTNPDYGLIGGLIGNWTECAKNVITQTWLANTDISNWIGQGGTQAILTASDSVYIGTGSGRTGASQPNWGNCPNVNDACADNGITWTNTVWNTDCYVSGTKDVLFGDQWGYNRRNGVASTFTCNDSAVDGGDPRIYDADGIKVCLIKDSSDIAVSNNYYGIWDPPAYSARSQSIIDKFIGDQGYINGGNPGFVAAFTDCIRNSCDFHLQAGSPLINAGTNLASLWTNPTDKDGNLRPQDSGWDMGAYEFVSGTPCVHKSELPPCDGCVSQPELTAFITRWYISSTDVTIKELMEAIGFWKDGC